MCLGSMHLTMMSVGASCEVKAKQQLVLFCFVLFVTATDLSKDLTDKIRTEGSSRKASKEEATYVAVFYLGHFLLSSSLFTRCMGYHKKMQNYVQDRL